MKRYVKEWAVVFGLILAIMAFFAIAGVTLIGPVLLFGDAGFLTWLVSLPAYTAALIVLTGER